MVGAKEAREIASGLAGVTVGAAAADALKARLERAIAVTPAKRLRRLPQKRSGD